jgi:hypothetical protein
MREDQLREDQRREALARKDEPHGEETLPPSPPPPGPVVHAEEVPAPRVERVEPVERVERVEQPKVDAKELLQSAGLVMIETDRSKAPARPEADEPQQHLGRPRRERPKAQPQDEPLEQVETRK